MRIILYITIMLGILINPGFSSERGNEKDRGNEAGNEVLYSEEGGSSDPFSQTKFVPAISFIMDVSYMNRNLGHDETGSLFIPGFLYPNSGEESVHGGSIVSGKNGFNLNYAELSLFAAVDPYFDLFTALHLSEEHFEVEEVYVTTRKLPMGFGMKIGKFLSSFGRMNSLHAHTWNFREAPLVYKVLFGDDGLLEKGVQLNWIAPTDFFLSIGFEVSQGENGTSFGVEGFELPEGEVEDVETPGLYTLFGKVSFDVGDLVILGGVSYAHGQSRTSHTENNTVNYFSGNTKVSGIDMTLKYLLDSYRYISIQTEYMNRDLDGVSYFVALNSESETSPFRSYGTSGSQSGFYSELVYRFSRLWRTAARYDLLNRNNMFYGGDKTELPKNMKRYSMMIDYSPTEFSRIRLQYNYNDYLYSDVGVRKFGELNLQLNIAIGAHGAHPF